MSAQHRLRFGVTVWDVADASREAVERFLLLAPTKLELACWLRGPYRRATSFVPHSLRSLTSNEQPLPPREVADVIHHAQCAARHSMAAALSPGAEGLARSLPEVLKLAEVIDVQGDVGYAPVDVPCCLADRVLALIVAEYLTRPEEFIANAEMLFPVRQSGSGVFERTAGGVIRKTPGRH